MNALPKALAKYRAARGWHRDDSSFATFTKACKAAGARNLVQELLDPFVIAERRLQIETPMTKGFKARPWYSAAELSRLWPIVCIGLASKQHGRNPSPATVAKRLIECGLPRLKQWDGSHGFRHNGKMTEFFIVQDVWRVANLRMTQTDFDRSMSQ